MKKGLTREEILRTEFFEDFVELMRNRMIQSFYKYGEVAVDYNPKCRIARPAKDSLPLYLQKYLDTGNTEYLVDVANFAMIELKFPSVEGAFFKETSVSPGVECSQRELELFSEENQNECH